MKALEKKNLKPFPVEATRVKKGIVRNVRIPIECHRCPLPNVFETIHRCEVCSNKLHKGCGKELTIYGNGSPDICWYCVECYEVFDQSPS